MLAEVTTIDDLLPGSDALQRQKLDVLERIRARLTPRVLAELDEGERETALRARPPDTLGVVGKEDLPSLVRRRFTENDGRIGTVFYVKPRNDVVFADGHNHLRLARTTDNVHLPDGTVVLTASRSTIFAEILKSMRADGTRVSLIAFAAVATVVVFAGRRPKWIAAVLTALVVGVVWLVGFAAHRGIRINYVNFIALPITLGIGCEYPFNIADRVRLLGGDVYGALTRSAGAVLLCSFTTTVGYGSLMFSDVQALDSFGELAVAGELACVFSAVFLLPSLLVLAGRCRWTRSRAPSRLVWRAESPNMYQLYIANKNYSSWSLRPWLLLRQLAIPFQERLVPFDEGSSWSSFRKFTPSGQVPCLYDGDAVIWNSLGIVEYLADHHAGVWSADAKTRAWARCAVAEMHAGFGTLRTQCGMNIGVRVRLHEISAALQRDIDRVGELWSEGISRFGGPFLAGKIFTAVDAFYAPVAFRIQSYGLALDDVPASYAARLLSLPSMRAWEADGIAETWRQLSYEADGARYGTVTEDRRAPPRA
ncbi:MAG TPA: glutathione S-transferase N-terminal domain-containing protein [Polyangiaceae bacterium]|nr:glutathione S-transferase N-terminal domain-containing protein [Polyangiaceae bacterium]